MLLNFYGPIPSIKVFYDDKLPVIQLKIYARIYSLQYKVFQCTFVMWLECCVGGLLEVNL